MYKVFSSNHCLRIAFLLFIVLMLHACRATSTQDPQVLREQEEALIYPLVISDLCRSNSGFSSIFVFKETRYEPPFPYDDFEYLLWKLPSLSKETYDDFQVSVQAKRVLNPALLSNNEFCKFITSDDLDVAVQQEPNWFHTHTLINFSTVGFSKDFNQALVYREYYCGSECAGGDLYFLVRSNNVWKIEFLLDGWRS